MGIFQKKATAGRWEDFTWAIVLRLEFILRGVLSRIEMLILSILLRM